MGTTYRLRRKSFTKYDDTDSLKRMKDSDILAEEKQRKPGFGGVAMKTVGGAAIGGAAGAGVGAGLALLNKSTRNLKAAGTLGKKLGVAGAAAGALGAGLVALNKRQKKSEETSFYNRRLKYAQRQAMRRERADWKSNNTSREGYSY